MWGDRVHLFWCPQPKVTGRIRLLFHCEEKELSIPFNLQDDSASWARVIQDIFQISDSGHRPEVD